MVAGGDYADRLARKKHLLWAGGEAIMETSVQVLIVFDAGNAELEQRDRDYRATRSNDLVAVLQG